MTSPTYTKTMLVREIAATTGITQKNVRKMLDSLKAVAYREAANQGFTIPDICRLDLVLRKARKMRNPQNGENFLISEHKALRIRPLKRAKTAINPVAPMVTRLSQEVVVIDDFSQAISFRCPNCSQEIEAPCAAVGMSSNCPMCNQLVVIPSESELGTLHRPLPTPKVVTPVPAVVINKPAIETQKIAHSQKNQTIRIDLFGASSEGSMLAVKKTSSPSNSSRFVSFRCKSCRQEIEATTDMCGTSADCPSCGVTFEVPFFSDPGTLHGSDQRVMHRDEINLMKSRTIRIEVPDEV